MKSAIIKKFKRILNLINGQKHEHECSCNHAGSADKMEVSGGIKIFSRFEEIPLPSLQVRERGRTFVHKLNVCISFRVAWSPLLGYAFCRTFFRSSATFEVFYNCR